MLSRFRPALLLGGWLFLCALPGRAQPICPDQTAATLLECLRAAYTPTRTYSYDRARDTLFAYVDDGDRTRITDVYAGRTLLIPPGMDPTIAGCNGDGDDNASTCNGALNFNTEHAYPQSKGAASGPGRSDLHHLYPARADANSARSNNPFGAFSDAQASKFFKETLTATSAPTDPDAWSATSTTLDRFRPRADVRGDLARSIFYFYTIYRTQADAADPAFFGLQKADLLAWHQADPPDAAEQARSARVRQHQGNDNPFVLEPSLVVRAYFPELMPVELVSFTALTRGDEVLLRWTTASETSNAGFAVEQLQPAGWQQIGYVAGRGTTNERSQYAHTVAGLAAGTYRFRLRQIDFDGTLAYTPVVDATIASENALTLTARGPALHLRVREAQAVRVTVYDALGRRATTLLDQEVTAGEDLSWTLSGTLAAGVYVVQAKSATGSASRVMVLR